MHIILSCYMPSINTVIKILRVGGSVRSNIQLREVTESLRLGRDRVLASFNLGDGSGARTSGNNLFAYRPRYQDRQSSGLAGMFINLEGVFPCLAPLTTYYPICRVYTDEDDGFRGGNDIIDLGDTGDDVRVFSTTNEILTYGFAIQNCPTFTTGCWAHYTSIAVACLLPRAACS